MRSGETVTTNDGRTGMLVRRGGRWWLAIAGSPPTPIEFADCRPATEAECLAHVEHVRFAELHDHPGECPIPDPGRRSRHGQRVMDALHRRAAYDEHFADD